MNSAPAYADRSGTNWLVRGRDWLDARGKGAWIALMVLGFIAFWPIGLAVLAYTIWSKRMFNGRNRMMTDCAPRMGRHMAAFRSSGNAAFDSYKADMLRRLEDEQEAFESFLKRLRDAKDKAEFDQFMEDRASRSAEAQPSEARSSDNRAEA